VLALLLPHDFELLAPSDQDIRIRGEVQLPASSLVLDLAQDQLDRLQPGQPLVIGADDKPRGRRSVGLPQQRIVLSAFEATRLLLLRDREVELDQLGLGLPRPFFSTFVT
jgi:hypothetical protein